MSGAAQSKHLNLSFRAGELEPAVRERAAPSGSLPGVAKRDLERYYATLAQELRRVRLSDAEWGLLRDALNSYLHTPGLRADVALRAQIEDAITLDGLAAKWGVDGDALLGRLEALSPTAALAIIDAVERWWLAEDPTGALGHADA